MNSQQVPSDAHAAGPEPPVQVAGTSQGNEDAKLRAQKWGMG